MGMRPHIVMPKGEAGSGLGVEVGSDVLVGVGVGVEVGGGAGVDVGETAGFTQLAAIAARTRKQRNRYNSLECLIILSIDPNSNESNFNDYTSVSIYYQIAMLVPHEKVECSHA